MFKRESIDVAAEPISLQLTMTIDDDITKFIQMVRRILRAEHGLGERSEARLRASQNALFSGEKPPVDEGLLVDTRQAAKLLGVSSRTVWRM